MAVDEAIMKARIENRVPNTLRFYQWSPSAVSIGRFQTLADEIHVDNCRKHGVDIVRRITGGGAVYHDQDGEITYSIVAKLSDLGCKDLDMLICIPENMQRTKRSRKNSWNQSRVSTSRPKTVPKPCNKRKKNLRKRPNIKKRHTAPTWHISDGYRPHKNVHIP